jgi:pyrroline-5-carboxylate reductase
VKQASLAFIGAGNMASALFGGLVQQGYEPTSIIAADPSEDCLARAAKLGIATTQDNRTALEFAELVILAVKPQALRQVLQPLRDILLRRRPLLLSIAAGVNLQSLEGWSDKRLPIVRCMPNTPALVQAGAAGLFANQRVSELQKQQAQSVLEAVGTAVWLDSEDQLHAVTAVSGSGPAYFFLAMEAMIEAGVKLGLSQTVAEQLTLQTALGASTMARQSDVGPAELRRRVTSPGGTTEQALLSFEQGDLKQLFAVAMDRCAQRSIELGRELGDDGAG